MASAEEPAGAAGDLIDVRGAAALVGRHPETVRRWISSGRLPARRQANRFLVARADLAALVGDRGVIDDLATWANRAGAARAGAGFAEPRRTAADLVIEDRGLRPSPSRAGAGR